MLVAQKDMNASRTSQCHHGNFGGPNPSFKSLPSSEEASLPLPPIMAFRDHPSTNNNSSGSSRLNASGTLDHQSFGVDFDAFNADCDEQQAGCGPSEGPSPNNNAGGRFQSFGGSIGAPEQNSWHQSQQLVKEMHFYQPHGFAPPPPSALGAFAGPSGSSSSSYDQRMGQMMPPISYYNHHQPQQHGMGMAPGNFFIGAAAQGPPQAMPHRNFPPGCGHHLSIMASNLNPPDHMLHIYPPNAANSANGREARNRAEKNRRDKLNVAIQDLATIVPHVADSARRVDKTAILRLTAHGFRLNHVFKNSMAASDRSNFAETFLQMMNGFLLTVTCRGQIVLVSSSLEQHLGHCQTDWYGQNILTYTHPDDHNFLKQQLVPTDLESLFDVHPMLDSAGEQRPRTKEEEDLIDQKLAQDRRDITIRLARAGPRSEPTVYEIVRLTGYFRRADLAPRGTKVTSFPGLHMIRRVRTREESFLPLHSISGNDIVLVGVGMIVRPPKICDRLLEACKTEYKTRHLIDGRIVQCEQAISIVAGYMTDEVTGLSPFAFMHKDEVRWVMVALRQMYDYNKPFGESCYRLMSRTGDFIYLKTRGYLEIDKDTNKVHSFVCINTLVSEEDGRRMVSEMKRKFSIICDPDAATSDGDSDDMSVENPLQIERAIMNLITNLDSGGDGPPSAPHRQDMARRAITAATGGADNRQTHSPPLAIIAPKPSTIKPSLKKTMEVISGKRPPPRSEDSDSEEGEGEGRTGTVHSRNSSRPSVVHRTTSHAPAERYGNGGSSTLPVAIKPEVQEQPNSLDYLSYVDVAGTSTSGSQYFSIKQEVSPGGEPLHSPASSTVSSWSCEPATVGGSSSSSIGGAKHAAMRNDKLSEAGGGEPTAKRRRMSSLIMEDLSDGGKQAPSIDGPGVDLIHKLPECFDALDRSLETIGCQADELRDQFLMMVPETTSEGDNAMSELSRSTEQLARIVEERNEQRDRLYSIRQDFGGRFMEDVDESSHRNFACGGDGQQVQEDAEEEREEHHQESILYEEGEDKSFDTNNLMPD